MNKYIEYISFVGCRLIMGYNSISLTIGFHDLDIPLNAPSQPYKSKLLLPLLIQGQLTFFPNCII